MTKVRALLFFVTLLPALNGLPLEESSTPISANVTKPSDLKVNPLLLEDKQQQKRQNSSPNPNDNDSTEQTLIEETYIEVLLPGVSQLNSSALESLLNSTSTNNSLSSTTSRIDTSSSTQGRSARDTSSEDNDDSSGEESKKPSNFDSSSDENSSEEKANTSLFTTLHTVNNF